MIPLWRAKVHQNPWDVTNLQKMPLSEDSPPVLSGIDVYFQERPLETSGLFFFLYRYMICRISMNIYILLSYHVYDDCRCICQQNEPSIGRFQTWNIWQQHEEEAKTAEKRLAETYRKTMEGQPYVSEVPGLHDWFMLVILLLTWTCWN